LDTTPGVDSAYRTAGVNTGLRIFLPALSWPVRSRRSRRRSSLAGSFPYCQLTLKIRTLGPCSPRKVRCLLKSITVSKSKQLRIRQGQGWPGARRHMRAYWYSRRSCPQYESGRDRRSRSLGNRSSGSWCRLVRWHSCTFRFAFRRPRGSQPRKWSMPDF
jgi:hypothetical protein